MRPLTLTTLTVLVVAQSPFRRAEFTRGTADAVGACAVDPNGGRCWDMDGRPDHDLSRAFMRVLAAHDAHAEPGRKSRYLAVRHEPSFRPRYFRNEGGSLQETQDLLRDEEGDDFVFVSEDASSRSAAIEVFDVFEGVEEGPLRFREGESLTVGSARVELGPSSRVRAPKGKALLNPASGHRAYGPLWSVIVGLTGAGGGYISWRYTPFDAKGARIRYVDASGRPISEDKARRLQPDVGPDTGELNDSTLPVAGTTPRAFAAYFYASGPSPAFRATTNIEAHAIRTLRIRPNYTESRLLGPFPLDPDAS